MITKIGSNDNNGITTITKCRRVTLALQDTTESAGVMEQSPASRASSRNCLLIPGRLAVREERAAGREGELGAASGPG